MALGGNQVELTYLVSTGSRLSTIVLLALLASFDYPN